MSETIIVREGEELDSARLYQFLQESIENLPKEPIEILQFGAGHSNLTYDLKIGSWEAVLRRPPLGPVAAKAHDMEREFRVLESIHQVFPTCPKPLVFTADKTIIGSPFFVMERRHGIVLDTDFPIGTADEAKKAQLVSDIMVDKLVQLHSIDYRKTALVDMVKPEGFMERQVQGWIGRYESAKIEDIQEVVEVTEWLRNRIPQSGESTIIHYDYKLNNAMFSEDYQEMVGLFDWEMTTVGDPLADLGAALSYWMQPDDPKMMLYGLGEPPITTQEGFYTRQQFIERYAEKSGRDVSNIHYYLTFAYFKLAVICQQIYFRYFKGQTKDKRFAHMGEFAKVLILQALASTKK
ncbi:phosphotransferase family protein [Rummeliibacillus sp. TYF005]|uniref:phosphotransferase family protein n=1 Tax=Rummeliibacillus sp. TYF005 TaxID=2058214 RepID=UPI000F53396D|nr:phosphotransferase family protein [Rummeliibacillus sp. TYF005]RPJ95109.1 phosphotransferase family protein [Rummeliibacillus sp. TYF005]